MTLSSAVANYGLSAIATPTGTNVSNDVRIGVAPAAVGFPEANIVYSFIATATGVYDTAQLTLDDGVVAATAGSPTITDGDGKDFEGGTLPTLATEYAYLVECVLGAATGITHSNNEFEVDQMATGDVVLRTFAGHSTSGKNITLILPSIGDSIRLTIIGKSS
jgi:hypothetical protein